MTLSTENIISAFDRAALTYDSFSPTQQKMGDYLIDALPKVHFHRAIDLGCGTGWLTKKLAANINYAFLEAIDASPCMLQRARQQNPSNIDFKTQSFDLLPSKTYDLIFSNMALQWSPNFWNTLKIVQAALQPNGIAAFTIPLWPTFQELEPYFNMHHFHTATTIVKQLESNLHLMKQTMFQEALSFSNTREALQTLKKTGVTICNNRNFSYRKARHAIQKNLVLQLTYHIGLFIFENQQSQ